jgi:hypothetical protein
LANSSRIINPDERNLRIQHGVFGAHDHLCATTAEGKARSRQRLRIAVVALGPRRFLSANRLEGGDGSANQGEATQEEPCQCARLPKTRVSFPISGPAGDQRNEKAGRSGRI